MRFFSKKTMALFMATAMLMLTLSACDPKTPPQPSGNTDEYTVTLDYNDEASHPRKVFVEKGKSIETPAEPLRTGYQLSEWTDAKSGGTAVSFPYTPAADVTLYAQWEAAKYDVTFDFNFPGSTPVVKEVAYNDTVSALAESEIPTRDGFSFRRWMTSAEGGDEVVFPYIVKRDVSFYATWMEEGAKSYSVTFDMNYGEDSVAKHMDYVEGDPAITITDAPVLDPRPGHTFLGWSLSPDAEEPEEGIFPLTPSDDVTIYAVWEAETYLVRFNYNYEGSANAGIMSEERYEYGYQLQEPTAPTRVNGNFTFEFDGWYNAAVGGTKATFPIEITSITNLYAHWISPLVETDTFDAEFTPFDPKYEFLGYSNSTFGVGAILSDLPGAHSADYPLLGSASEVIPHYVTYLFKPGATLTFNIYSDKAVSGVTLYLALSNEFFQYLSYGPEDQPGETAEDGINGYQISVNGTPLKYNTIDVDGGPNAGGGMYKGSVFSEYKVSATFSLKAGLNTITLTTYNTTACGGTTQATAPTVDYIRVEASGAKLSWHPEYDNLYREA